VIEPLLAVNVAVVAAAATVTDAGTVRTFAIAPPIVTTAPAGAAFVRVTVQVVLTFDARVPVAHCRDETSTGADSVRFTGVEEPLSDAVTVAVWSDVTEPVLAVNVALVAAAATVTDGGTVRTLAIAPLIVTAAPPAGAAFVRVMVQMVLAFEARVPVAHCREETSIELESTMFTAFEKPFSDAVTAAV